MRIVRNHAHRRLRTGPTITGVVIACDRIIGVRDGSVVADSRVAGGGCAMTRQRHTTLRGRPRRATTRVLKRQEVSGWSASRVRSYLHGDGTRGDLG